MSRKSLTYVDVKINVFNIDEIEHCRWRLKLNVLIYDNVQECINCQTYSDHGIILQD